MGRFLDTDRTRFPANAILTDDPMRVKMLVAHHLENAELIGSRRGMTAYAGTYGNAPVAVYSVGFGEASTLAYLQELAENGVEKIVYVGECLSRADTPQLMDAVLAVSSGGAWGKFEAGDDLLRRASSACARLSIPVYRLPVFTNDLFWIEGEQNVPSTWEVIDYATNAVFWYADRAGISALSILTVSEHLISRQRVGDAARQSRFHNAARLAFEIWTGPGPSG